MANLRRDNVDPAVISLVPEEMAREHMAFPVRLEDDGLVRRGRRAERRAASAALARRAGQQVKLMHRAAQRHHVGDRQQLPRHRRRRQARPGVRVGRGSQRSARRRSPSAEIVDDDAPVVQVVDRILTQAMRDRASDVHIEPSDDVVRVRFRIDGALKEVLQLPAAIGPGS